MILPHDENIEKSILSALMTTDAINDIYDIISKDSFHKISHQIIFESIKELSDEGKTTDLISVTDNLRSKNLIEKAGGVLYLTEITSIFVGTSILENHCAILKQFQLQRYLIEFATKQVNLIKERSDVEENLNLFYEASETIDNILSFGSNVRKLSQNIDIAIEQAYKRVQIAKSGDTVGITTGLSDLNKKLTWVNSELIVIAARPGMGKTALCLKHAKEAAKKGNHVRIYSLEMSDIGLTNRILLSECDIPADNFKFGYMENEDLKKLEVAASKLERLNIWIDDKPARTISSLSSDCRKHKKKGECDLIIIDYLQLTESESQYGSTNDKVSVITRGLKKLAKELDVPVIILSQLNRDVEKRADKMPQLSDLRDSGAIEQDADKVLFIYRPAYYGIMQDANEENLENLGLYIVAKNRDGSTGAVKFRHNEALTKIYDYSEEYKNINDLPF